MTDGYSGNSVKARKYIWDEENRLTAVCDNGYVSAYLYDADRERVFKASGDATHMYVNAAEAPGATTDTRSFTLYVSPYLVVCEDGRYTKHFYAGSQRIVSKVGDRASYGSDPRTIDRAGNDYDSQLRVDYEAKKAALESAIAAQYEVFGVPFRGIDHDNRTDAPRRSFADPAQYESQQYFYHPDHLGSTSYVTDAEGNVAQHVEYVPFGEVLVDQRAADWNAPYLFNAKELDEETGLYYYGARYYDPRLSLWMSTDPMEEKHPDLSTYTYCGNNPVRLVDMDGMEFTEASEKHLTKLINEVNSYQNDIKTQILKKQQQLTMTNLSNKRISKLNKEMSELSDRFNKFQSVLDEISILRESTQIYNIKRIVSSYTPDYTGTTIIGGSSYNRLTDEFDIEICDNTLGILAHELKHAYQFETGTFSSGSRKNGDPFYDQTDEFEAYDRGTMFGAPKVYYLPDIYKNLKEEQSGVNLLPKVAQESKVALQSIATKNNAVFRWNGVTYKPKH